MKPKIFIDGSEGTTGLRIFERFQTRSDIELLAISSDLRKDVAERKRLINESDVTILCLPDDAARESVSLIENEKVRIIDASTAHRTEEGWVYGFPELNSAQRQQIRDGRFVAVPGCHAVGFIALAYPLLAGKIMTKDYPVSVVSITGYSGGGKKMIAEYKDPNRPSEYNAPRAYAVQQQHKHLKEMKGIVGLYREPMFTPIVADFYSGMLVSLPLHTEYLSRKTTPEEIHGFLAEHYANQDFVKVEPFGIEAECGYTLSSNACSDWDGMKIYVTGNAHRVLLTSQFDNLGKGASGSAIQCLNIMLNCNESAGLNL